MDNPEKTSFWESGEVAPYPLMTKVLICENKAPWGSREDPPLELRGRGPRSSLPRDEEREEVFQSIG
jgi:hypothetical protein